MAIGPTRKSIEIEPSYVAANRIDELDLEQQPTRTQGRERRQDRIIVCHTLVQASLMAIEAIFAKHKNQPSSDFIPKLSYRECATLADNLAQLPKLVAQYVKNLYSCRDIDAYTSRTVPDLIDSIQTTQRSLCTAVDPGVLALRIKRFEYSTLHSGKGIQLSPELTHRVISFLLFQMPSEIQLTSGDDFFIKRVLPLQLLRVSKPISEVTRPQYDHGVTRREDHLRQIRSYRHPCRNTLTHEQAIVDRNRYRMCFRTF